MSKPWMVMMVGLPGSGKSTFAKTIRCGDKGDEKPVIHSSDDLRAEMFGSAEIQGDTNKLFNELHRRIKVDLQSGKSVVYDATNINKKQRIAFLRELKNIPCVPICFDQENNHHSLSLGEHCSKTGYYLAKKVPENYWLYIAGLLHDVGKLYTKTRKNKKGEFDGNYHYYNHQNAGSYTAMFYLYGISLKHDKNGCPLSYATNLIYYHMHPYLSWKQSEKAMKKDRNLLGEDLFNDILLLHEADLAAH